MLERIDDLKEPPIIGSYYLVPHIKISKDLQISYEDSYMPVIGDFHSDIEICKYLGEHIHPDWRFVSNKIFHTTSKGFVITNQDIISYTIVFIPSKCKRYFEFPTKLCKKLEPIYLGKKSGCAVCPHRGIALSSEIVDNEGYVICPGHSLKVRVADGEIVKRTHQHSLLYKITDVSVQLLTQVLK